MFYIFLIIKALYILLTPIFSIKKILKKDTQNLNLIATTIYFIWAISIILIITVGMRPGMKGHRKREKDYCYKKNFHFAIINICIYPIINQILTLQKKLTMETYSLNPGI